MSEDLVTGPLRPGLYRICWAEGGGTSVATVGVTANGGRWLAPTNWIAPVVPFGSRTAAAVFRIAIDATTDPERPELTDGEYPGLDSDEDILY